MTRRSRISVRDRIAAALLATAAFPGTAFAGVIVGTVGDASGTRNLQSATVEIVELGRMTAAEADGSYRFADVPAGTYTLRSSYAGLAGDDRQVIVPETGTVTADLVIGRPEDAQILVIGQAANLAGSISRQRASETIDTVLTRDAIGQFPDQNVAEALRRAPGINILNDQGEGRFVSVRGLDPNLNSASINGNRVPAPEADVRSVALDVIPAELIESIEIRKSLTPDMDPDTLGASIDINTTSAFDRRRGFLAASVSGSYNDLRDALSPKASLDFATRLGENFGIAGGFSYFRRRFATDNIEADGWDEAGGIVFADTIEYRDYDVRRERIGASLSLDWRPAPGTTLYARGLYSRFDDLEARRSLIFEMDEEPSSGTGSSATFLSDDGEIQVTRDLKDRQETQTITSISVGGRTETGPWRFAYDAYYSHADENERGSVDPVAFERVFEDPGELALTFDYSRRWNPAFSIGAGQAAFNDPSEYEFDSIDRTTRSAADDEQYGFRFDATRRFALGGGGTFDLQFGGRVRFREKTFDLTMDIFDGYDGAGDFTLADVLGAQSYGLAALGPMVGVREWRRFLNGDFSRFERDPIDSDFESAIEDFSVREDIYAGYLLGRYDNGRVRIVGGVRVERTENDIRGNLVELVEEGAERDGVVLDDDTIFVTPTRFERAYTDWFPSLNIRYEPARNLLLRFGGYRSILRPNFGQLAPRFVVEENDDNEREGEFGNPNLLPYRAWNLDLSAEYYFARNALVQVGFFYKSIRDFIVEAEFEDVTFNGVFANEAVIPINGDRARVIGFEFSYQQQLRFLPAPLDGLLVNFNYTFTDAEGEVDGRTIPLPAAARHTFNAVLGYEKGPVSFRLAGAYRSRYLDELGGDPDEDRYVRRHFQFDASARFRLTPNIQLFAEIVNAFDAPYVAYQRGPVRRNLLQYEEYSWTGNFGVRVNF